MDIGTISSRYAKALFSLAKEKGIEDRIYENMKVLAENFTAEPGLKAALSNPVITTANKVKLLKAAGGIQVNDLYVRFINLVIRHKREMLL